MRIVQISDLHIRNLKFHSEYRKTFDNFYRKLDELKPDLVVNTGDTAHTKTNISPEFVEMASDLLTQVAKRAPVVSVLGNHDLNLMNADRQDAISPIVDALNNPRIILWKKSGPHQIIGSEKFKVLEDLCFWNFGISDVENWPTPPYNQNHINIGLFHGSIRNCVTDSLFRMTHVEYDEDIFKGLDFAMMGDIHKRQWFNDQRVWYAGSMIQQNFGEDPEKGFLVWDINDRDDFKVNFHELRGARKFYTIKLPDDLRVPDAPIEEDSRIRISPPRTLTLVEQRTVEKLVRKKYHPHDVITLGVSNIGQMMADIGGKNQKLENLRDVGVQEQLLRDYLADRKITAEVMERIVGLNRKYQVAVEQKEDMARGVNWRVLKIGFNNLYNYGDGNVVDFSQIKGLSGIFAPNAAGKSSLIDAITVGMFDANTKEVGKNIHLVNDNKDKAAIIVELLANGERYTVQREIERIKFTRKGEEKQWGKTSLDFIRHDRDGGIERLVQENRPDTEKQIRRRFGTFEDFMLTALFAQWDPMDLIMCKETDRKRILFRFLDLDIFEEKAKMAKEESKKWMDKLIELEEGGYEQAVKNLDDMIEETQKKIATDQAFIEDYSKRREIVEAEIEQLLEQKVPMAVAVSPEADHRRLALVEGVVKRKRDELSQKEASCRDLAEGLTFTWRDFAIEDCKKKIERLEEIEQAFFSIKRAVGEGDRQVADRKRQIEILNKVPCGDKFPTCQFLVDAFSAKAELAPCEEQVAKIRNQATALTDEARELHPFRVQMLAYERDEKSNKQITHELALGELDIKNRELEIERLEIEIATLTTNISRAEQVIKDIERNQELDIKIGTARLNKREIERVTENARKRLGELNRQLGADQGVRERLHEALKQLIEVRDTCSAYEHFISAMGKDGIALHVLTQKLPLINEEINKILGSATEFGVFIEYDPEDQSIRLYLQYGQYKSRLLELGSGAEKFLASVAIRAALLSISNLPRSNMFIIDEGFGKLDPQNLESIQRMFDYLKSVFDHVIVISHTDIMKDMVDNMIEITTDDEGYAHVEIGG
jgi:DNA repair exonuclease SbcCD ATPase subunit/DNA repair exonuclease SbcCD nuclease subunit